MSDKYNKAYETSKRTGKGFADALIKTFFPPIPKDDEDEEMKAKKEALRRMRDASYEKGE